MKAKGVNRRSALLGVGAVAVVSVGFVGTRFAGGGRDVVASAHATRIEVHKNPNCGCCAVWADYLAERGWQVSEVNRRDVGPVKKQAGVPAELAGCHTAFVEGYVVEGHVPAAALDKLLAEWPDLDGIAVPGMPADSPGMGGGGEQAVVGFKNGKPTGVFVRTA